MKLQIVLRYIAFAFLFNALFMIVSAIISLIYADGAFMPLLYSGLVTALFGIFPLIFIPPTTSISNKEGHLIVVGSWLLSCLVGMLPYLLWGSPFDVTNAWFESVSGYTTTGSSILSNVEALPQGLLFWRASTHWIGGIGIIIFVLSALPFLGMAEIVLYRSEISSMARENFHHRAKKTIRIIAGVYGGLTLLETIVLLFCGMNIFDAVTHAFATIATGGFSTKNASIAYFNSPAIEIVVILFMILSGIHFATLFAVISGQWREFWKSHVVRFYIAMLFFGILVTTLNVHGIQFTSWADSLRYASFQIVSIGTSTGFSTTDTAVWPPISQLLILFFALQCACVGSTSGGIKVDRLLLFAKTSLKYLKQLKHPNAVIPVNIDNQTVQEDILSKSNFYILLYLAVVFLSTFLLSLLGVDNLSAFSGTIATIGNVGPGLGSVGSISNFNHIPDLGKWILSLTMLLGRLEIYGFFLLFSRAQWRKTVAY
jgi:trk system potassium uptake protein TrkH